MSKKIVSTRSFLQRSLDREIRQVVQKLQVDYREGLIDGNVIYEWIRGSNSHLSRKPRAILEQSIDRVLSAIEPEGHEQNDELITEKSREADNIQTIEEKSNSVNSCIVESWGTGIKYTDKKRENCDNSSGINGYNGNLGSKKRKHALTVMTKDLSKQNHCELEDIGGLDDVKKQLKDSLVLPLLCPQEYVKRRIPLPKGILLHGPPGCGKTMLARAFAAKLGVPLIEILGPSVVTGMSGASEKLIREHFQEAKKLAPSIIFIDEIDVIAPKRDSSQSQMEKRIVAQLLISMDDLSVHNENDKTVIVLAATNRPHSLDSALRRGGRFDTEIEIGIPSEKLRSSILQALTRGMPVADDVKFDELAKMTPGFVGADLRDLVTKAGTCLIDQLRDSLERQAEQEETVEDTKLLEQTSDIDKSIIRLIRKLKNPNLYQKDGFDSIELNMKAFLNVLPFVQASIKREGFTRTPKVSLKDVGALTKARNELVTTIVQAIQEPSRFLELGITAPSGVLLWGPPGCGKTLLAQAIANEAQANFISVKGPELLNKFVGESERTVRKLFARARSCAPCIIFFDEFDALAPRRTGIINLNISKSNDHDLDGSGGGISEASARVVNALLTEMDALEYKDTPVHIIAATNRPDIIDPAILRPERLDTLLYIGLPEPHEREEILRTLLIRRFAAHNESSFSYENKNLRDTSVPSVISHLLPSIPAIAKICDKFSGADLSNLLRRAGLLALERGDKIIQVNDLIKARSLISPSVRDYDSYERLARQYISTV